MSETRDERKRVWVDVRVCREDVPRAIAAVHAKHPMTWFMHNPVAPASGPEAELTFEAVPEEEIVALLTLEAVSVLASRTRKMR